MTDVWKRVNITTILIAPLLNDMMKGTKTKSNRFIIPFLQIADEYGFRSSYLYTEKETSGDTITLVFDKRVLHDKKLTNSPYKSLSARMVDYKHFKYVRHYDDCGIITYTFDIPECLHDDIKKIINSKYSTVSKKYQNIIVIKEEHIAKWSNSLGLFICQLNLPFGVTKKTKSVKKAITDALNCDIPDDNEFLSTFDKNRETFDLRDYCK